MILSNAERAGRSFWKPASFDFDLMLFAWMRKSTPAPKARAIRPILMNIAAIWMVKVIPESTGGSGVSA